MFETVKVHLSDATPFSKICEDFQGGFWGEKIVKGEQNLKKIIQKILRIQNPVKRL